MTTIAKPKHKEARRLYLEHLDLHPGRTVGNDLDPLEAGIVGDPDHDGGYHISRQDNDPDDYSVDESPRDRRGRSDYASAMDIGYFKVTTRRGAFDLYDFNRWLVGLCKAGDPDTADLREIIYSLDGRTVKRWDRLGKRSSGDSSHRTHTHLSEHRDASGQRMVNLARRWLQHIGLLAGEDDDVSEQDVTNALNKTPSGWQSAGVGRLAKSMGLSPKSLRLLLEMDWEASVQARNLLLEVRANQAAMLGKDWVNEPQIIDGVLSGLGSKDLDDAAIALRAAFGDRVEELAAKLAASESQARG